jgi:hypothetical protein
LQTIARVSVYNTVTAMCEAVCDAVTCFLLTATSLHAVRSLLSAISQDGGTNHKMEVQNFNMCPVVVFRVQIHYFLCTVTVEKSPANDEFCVYFLHNPAKLIKCGRDLRLHAGTVEYRNRKRCINRCVLRDASQLPAVNCFRPQISVRPSTLLVRCYHSRTYACVDSHLQIPHTSPGSDNLVNGNFIRIVFGPKRDEATGNGES